jgi:hypothetical protein
VDAFELAVESPSPTRRAPASPPSTTTACPQQLSVCPLSECVPPAQQSDADAEEPAATENASQLGAGATPAAVAHRTALWVDGLRSATGGESRAEDSAGGDAAAPLRAATDSDSEAAEVGPCEPPTRGGDAAPAADDAAEERGAEEEVEGWARASCEERGAAAHESPAPSDPIGSPVESGGASPAVGSSGGTAAAAPDPWGNYHRYIDR